jgi:hypothetical protein
LRKFQIAVLVFATASSIAAACFIGKKAGNELGKICFPRAQARRALNT